MDVYEKRCLPEDKETSRNYVLVLHVRGLRALQAAGFDMSSFEHSFQGEPKHSPSDVHVVGLQAADSDMSSLQRSLVAGFNHSSTCGCTCCKRPALT